MKSIKHVASAPAKVILFGEHFVVYGAPAILAAINRRTTATARIRADDKIVIRSDIGTSAEYSRTNVGKRDTTPNEILEPIHDAVKRVLDASDKSSGVELDLQSEIPYGIGLGSSAASCVSAIAAVDSLFASHQKKWVCERAIESERMIHKNSSGADCYISTFGGIMRYSKDVGYKGLEVARNLNLVVSSTGIRHSTGDLVERVRTFREAGLLNFSELAKQASEICGKAEQSIRSGNLDNLGRLMTENQVLLKGIGVSHRKAEELIELSMKAGALGAKITGAGGGGAVIALARSRGDGARIASLISNAGYESLQAQVDHKGLIR
jgi:mevalonate kinase